MLNSEVVVGIKWSISSFVEYSAEKRIAEMITRFHNLSSRAKELETKDLSWKVCVTYLESKKAKLKE